MPAYKSYEFTKFGWKKVYKDTKWAVLSPGAKITIPVEEIVMLYYILVMVGTGGACKLNLYVVKDNVRTLLAQWNIPAGTTAPIFTGAPVFYDVDAVELENDSTSGDSLTITATYFVYQS